MHALKEYFDSISPIRDGTWQAVQRLFQPDSLNKGEYFIKVNQFATQFGFLESGVVRAYYQDELGIEYNKHFFVAPAIVGGYTSLITGKPNQIGQQALTDCKLLRADYSELVSLYDVYPDLERVGRRFAERYFVQKEQKEVAIVLHNAETRYLHFRQEYPHLEQQIAQYHIASYLGITPTQLSRIRKKLSQP